MISETKDSLNIKETIEDYFKYQRKRSFITSAMTLVLFASAIATIAGCLLYCIGRDEQKDDTVYVLSESGAASATLLEDRTAMMGAEVTGHVIRFHELMFDLSPDLESIQERHSKAYALCDHSGRDYHNDMQETGFYTRLASTGSIQRLKVDSLKTDTFCSPMTARVYGKLYILRQSSISMYDFESSCRVLVSERTPSNPHGLMIENFLVQKSTLIETRKRD